MLSGQNTLADIRETPVAISRVIKYREELTDLADEILRRRPRKIFFAGSGSSYYAALISQSLLINAIDNIYLQALPSSELYIYYKGLFDHKTIIISFSRSGETREALSVLEEARKRGSYTIMLSIARESRGKEIADKYIYLNIGVERSIIMTKSFTTLSLAGILLSLEILGKWGDANMEPCLHCIESFAEEVVNDGDFFLSIGEKFQRDGIDRFVYLGSGPAYPVALEASLKMKETSYIAAEALHALEFRHGPIATVGEKQAIVLINQTGKSYDRVYRLYEDIKNIGGSVLRISDAGEPDIKIINANIEELTALSAIIPLQLITIGYALASHKDPDHPRNLVRYVDRF